MDTSELFDSLFYSIRVTGKNWLSLPEVVKYVSEVIAFAEEKRIPHNSILYGPILNFNYPVTVTRDHNSIKYQLKHDLDVIVIDDEQIAKDLKKILKPYRFKSIKISDLQIIFREIGLKAYITNDRIVIMKPQEYLKTVQNNNLSNGKHSSCECNRKDEGW